MPGRGWLQYEVQESKTGSKIVQTAVFEPRGIAGLLYWHALWPLHQVVFSGTLRGLQRACEQTSEPSARLG